MAIREEIVSGLRNATARGESLEKAVQSFINAGYNPEDVHTAAEELRTGGDIGVLGQMHIPEETEQVATPEQEPLTEEPTQENPELQYQPLPEQNFQQQLPQQTPQIPQTAKPKSRSALKIAIIIVVLLMILTLAGIAIFGTTILDALFK